MVSLVLVDIQLKLAYFGLAFRIVIILFTDRALPILDCSLLTACRFNSLVMLKLGTVGRKLCYFAVGKSSFGLAVLVEIIILADRAVVILHIALCCACCRLSFMLFHRVNSARLFVLYSERNRVAYCVAKRC